MSLLSLPTALVVGWLLADDHWATHSGGRSRVAAKGGVPSGGVEERTTVMHLKRKRQAPNP